MSLLTCEAVFAAGETWIAGSDIVNAKTQILQLKAQTSIPVIFPSQIPAPKQGQTFYISHSSYGIKPNYARYWQLNVDVTPECQGARVCNIGYISAEKGGRISNSFEKELVHLPSGISAYYTPFHIAAGAVQPTLEWRQANVKYTLSWTIDAPAPEQKSILLKIANFYNDH